MMDKESFIRKHRNLFWSVSNEKLADVSNELMVENVLNFGTLDDIKELI